MEEINPAAVIGCGGIASAAPILAARRRGSPCLLLEQNVIPGRTTRWLSRWGGTVCVTYPQSAQWLARSATSVVTGNPVRRSIAALAASVAPKAHRTLLVLGGSQGSQTINEMLLDVVSQEPALLKDWRIVHQTGPHDVERVRAAYESHHLEADISKFFGDPAAHYGTADVVVSRAGGTTLSELACAGLPVVLCPYPHAAANHQWHNAAVFRKAGAAIVVEESADRVQNACQLAEALQPLLRDHGLRQRMSAAMRALARPDAADQVVRFLDRLLGNSIVPDS
jgi:UDP-N-acetylglucosamine--N-acetylmuramyl-(pentapeptide) pyrophosphoryl-undecaprenol N-acetylglucosamine transferase